MDLALTSRNPADSKPDSKMNQGQVVRLAKVFKHSSNGIVIQSPDGDWLEANPAFCRLLGYSREELLSRSFREITHPEDLERSLHQLRRLKNGELSSFCFDKRYLHADGREIWVRLDVSAVLDEQGGLELIIVQAHDITASRQIRRQLADSEARLRSVITSMAEGMLVHDMDGRITLGNDRAADILGLEFSELVEAVPGNLPFECIRLDGSPFPSSQHPLQVTLQSGQPQREIIMGIQRDDGRLVWIEISTQPVREKIDGKLQAVVATFSDITDRILTERALQNSEERLSMALDGAKLGMWDWRLDTHAFSFSRLASSMLGYLDQEVTPSIRAVRELAHPDDESELVDAMEAHLCGSTPFFDVDIRMRRKSGAYEWSNLRGRVTERGGDDRPLRVTGTLMDISERKSLEARLTELATRDELTGLYNRRYGKDMLVSEIERVQRSGGALSFVLLDIDHFKSVNDCFGHDVGDRVLEQLSGLILARIRKSDAAARWGGEEFALILPDTGLDGAGRFSEQLLNAMDAIRRPDDQGISASFGVVEYKAGETASELVKRADRLMYRAKNAGRARVESGASE
ncbi:MAG: PAS domain S-box protein [Wenzhouxiangellaceae bacterium]|nr:PAS domain S-box protein [Wenzhouxiangellaceae bacterium]